ncbi:hypothetical protein [Teredinibacter waterburyi]|jgi:hypothetical protein|uniref:hypothetical protein n=1 Tax=Teredinibacter waterburyi TaxID=1500538 RepID=UPI00165F0B99|nr:hypothetical protein [Teredinibacter waterburyi]
MADVIHQANTKQTRPRGGKAKVVMFGGGLIGRQLLPLYKKVFDLVAIADNDPSKNGSFLEGVPIISAAEIPSLEYDYVMISSTSLAVIRRQLLELNIPNERIKDYDDQTIRIRERFPWDALILLAATGVTIVAGLIFATFKIMEFV